LPKLAAVEIANMCSKKDVPLLPFFEVFGSKVGAKVGAKWGLKCAYAQAKNH
jgi:hypothetical protein